MSLLWGKVKLNRQGIAQNILIILTILEGMKVSMPLISVWTCRLSFRSWFRNWSKSFSMRDISRKNWQRKLNNFRRTCWTKKKKLLPKTTKFILWKLLLWKRIKVVLQLSRDTDSIKLPLNRHLRVVSSDPEEVEIRRLFRKDVTLPWCTI